ncbi:MAG: hypothetical protein WDM77_14890 [Steroidobacteraceae bacterium]
MAVLDLADVLDDMQPLAVDDTDLVYPGAIVQGGGINDQRIALPMSDRIAHEAWRHRLCVRLVHVDVADVMGPLRAR